MKKKKLRIPFSIILILAIIFSSFSLDTFAKDSDSAKSLVVDEKLIEKANKEGKIQVIIGINTEFTPEGKLNSSELKNQRKKIRDTQESVLTELKRKEQIPSNSVTKFKTIPYLAIEVSSNAIEQLRNNPRVTSITENAVLHIPETKTKESKSEAETKLYETNNVMNTDMAWSAGITGEGQTIAIIDTGVDLEHSFLAGKVVSEACFSLEGGCPGGATSSTAVNSGMDYMGHGTHVAGIAAGTGSEFSGVAKNAKIIAINTFGQTSGAYFSDVTKGLERVYELKDQYNIASVNMSLGGSRFYSPCGGYNTAMEAIIGNLKSVGIASVASSGNEYYKDSLSFPACIPGAISVGATDNSDSVAYFSNSADFLDLLAPGAPVYSANLGGGFISHQGTSMAAPQVAGAFALMKQRFPNDSVDTILNKLKNNGVSVQDNYNGIIKPRIDFSWMTSALPSLSQVQKPTWSSDTLKWNGVSNAAQYQLKLYKSGTLIETLEVSQSTRQFNFSSRMDSYGAGAYQASVRAIGDGINYGNGPDSGLSATNTKGLVYFEGFEEGDGNFVSAGINSSWEWGTPTSGPGSAYSGSNVWATNLDGNYSTDEISYIESPAINLSNVSSPVLSWAQYAVSEDGYDDMTVDISKDGGETWDNILIMDGAYNEGWMNPEYELSSVYAVPEFKIRFGLESDYMYTYPGFYVDNIAITGKEVPVLGYIDTPKQGTVVSGTTSLSGWILDNSGVSKVEVYVDGHKKGEAEYGLQRNDIYNAYPEYNNQNSGFSYRLDTTRIANGSHVITVRAIGNNGNTTDFSRTALIGNELINRGSIDTPGAGNETFGTIPLMGWMLTGSGVRSIETLVDGVKYGEAFYGLSRQDVFNAFPQYNNLNAGYVYNLDTTNLANGNRTITVKTIDNDGKLTSLNRTISVNNLPTKLSLDAPAQGSKISGTVPVSGWALVQSNISKIEVLVNGVKQGEAHYGLARQDVFNAFPQYDNRNAGYVYNLDTTKLTNRTSNITVRAIAKNGKITEMTRAMTVENLPTKVRIDSPNKDSKLEGTATIKGWILEESGVQKVEVLVDGEKQGEAHYGLEREDVFNSYPQYNNQNAGYSYNLDTTKLANGNRTITVRSIAKNGKVTEAILTVVVENLPSKIRIDSPNKDSKVEGTATIRGWILEKSGVQKVEVLVDGEKQGEAHYGLEREDVFNSYPQYNNRNAGYSYNLDTTKLANGNRTITVRSIAKDGKVTEIHQTVVINNFPTRLSLDSPAKNTTVSGSISLSGWLLDQNEVGRIEIFLDGMKQGEAYYGIEREDVYNAFPQYNNEKAGYVFKLDTTKFANGTRIITVRAIGSDGKKTDLTRSIIVSN